jgi:hypothetical protein
MMSYSARHLGFGHLAAGEWDQAHERLTESLRLRRAVGHQPGVAAGLLALAELAVRTLRWIGETRAELARQSGA